MSLPEVKDYAYKIIHDLCARSPWYVDQEGTILPEDADPALVERLRGTDAYTFHLFDGRGDHLYTGRLACSTEEPSDEALNAPLREFGVSKHCQRITWSQFPAWNRSVNTDAEFNPECLEHAPVSDPLLNILNSVKEAEKNPATSAMAVLAQAFQPFEDRVRGGLLMSPSRAAFVAISALQGAGVLDPEIVLKDLVQHALDSGVARVITDDDE